LKELTKINIDSRVVRVAVVGSKQKYLLVDS